MERIWVELVNVTVPFTSIEGFNVLGMTDGTFSLWATIDREDGFREDRVTLVDYPSRDAAMRDCRNIIRVASIMILRDTTGVIYRDASKEWKQA